MHEREIRKYINRLNQAKGQESIFTRQISDRVIYSTVWSRNPKEIDEIGHNDSNTFFFIKNSEGKYIGAVLDIGNDLHWYVLPKHRKMGHLTNALKESILPFIFYELREKQRITIDSAIGEKKYSNSKAVAEKLGFIPTNISETEFELDKEKFDWQNEKINHYNDFLGKERIETLKKRVNFASKILKKVSDELMTSYLYDNELKELSDKVASFAYRVEDLWRENEKPNKT